MPFSLLAALLTSVASMVTGFLWYGPLFAKPWMKEVGLTEKEIGNGPGAGYALAMLASFSMGAAMSWLVKWTNIMNINDALTLGLVVGLGFVSTTFATNYIFAMKSKKLFAIDASYQTLIVVLAAIIGFYLK